MTVDFAGSAPQVTGKRQRRNRYCRVCDWYCVRLLANEDVPVNHGCFQPVKVITPPGQRIESTFPAAVVGGQYGNKPAVWSIPCWRLGAGFARCHSGGVTRHHEQFRRRRLQHGAQFVYTRQLAAANGGSSGGAGLSGRQCHMTNTLNTPVEALEHSFADAHSTL